MKIRLLKAYQLAAAGEEMDPDAPVALLLIERGLAILIEDASPPPARKPADLPKPAEIKRDQRGARYGARARK